MPDTGCFLVQIDAMGTTGRSKAFMDTCWKNLGDAGLPDRIPWIKAAAARYPQMDLRHGVGIFGSSYGGYVALRALETRGDFYTAASSSCGMHDLRLEDAYYIERWMGPLNSLARLRAIATAGFAMRY
jgi:dipeptidyl-peptidase-4